MINVNATTKNIIYVKKIMKNGKYLASIIDDSVITCDEIIDAEGKLFDEETKTVPTKFNEKK